MASKDFVADAACPACGLQTRPGARFCEGCGVRLEKSCAACGAKASLGAGFCGECGARFGSSSAASAPAKDASAAALPVAPKAGAAIDTAAPEPSSAPERRQLTLLFCDLVGSTALSERLDPEQWRDALQAYQKVCAEAVARYGGYLAQYLGDGVLAYFGYPQGHEDDARRSIHSGLAVIAGVQALSAQLRQDIGADLNVRVGVHTGLVVTGEMGEGPQRERLSAVGEAPNIAARIQSLAEPGQLLASAATQRLVVKHFDCEALGLHSLKGLSTPLELFRISGAQVQSAQRAASAPGGAAALVGRDSELRLLLELWNHARCGQGHAVVLSGEAGIGKSALLAALQTQALLDGGVVHSLYCSPYYQASALYPAVDLLERCLAAPLGIASLAVTAPPAERIERLLAASNIHDAAAMALLASLLGVEPASHWPLPALAPDQRKRKTFEALLNWLLAQAKQGPLLVVVEDLHWIDASTLEWLGQLLQQVAGTPLLAVFSCRPEFAPPWGLHSHVTITPLTRLTRAQVIEVAQRVALGKRLPEQVLEQIAVKTDGVPLFVEELTRMVLDSGLLGESGDGYELLGPLPDLAIPNTLLASLTARLDRLGHAKGLAQLGSVLGREFSFELLRECAELGAQTLESQLDQLVQAEILFRRGVGAQSQYVFKHALVQGAAYDTLLKSARQRMHAAIAQVHVEKFPELAALRPEMVAHHFSRAGQTEPAMDHWQRAGELAISRSGYAEAITHFNAALELLEPMAPTEERDRRELGIRVKLGPAFQTIKGMGSEEAGRNYNRACEIGERLGHSAPSFMGLWGHWLYCALTGQIAKAKERAGQLVAMSQELRDDDLVLQAYHARWTTFQALGETAVTRFDTQQGQRLYDVKRHGHHAHVYGGHDPGVCSRAQGGMSSWIAGYPEEADRLCRSGVELGRELDHPFSLAVGLWFASWVKMISGDVAGCKPLADELLNLSQQRSFKTTESAAMVMLGWTRVQGGESQDGLRLMEQGEAMMRKIGQHAWRHCHMASIAQVRADLGETAQALELTNQAIELAERTGQGAWRPELLRQRALWMHALGQIDRRAAKDQLMSAIALAREQSARMLELRGASALANLLAGSEDAQFGAAMLSDCLKTFTEGFDSLDLRAARQSLDSIANAA